MHDATKPLQRKNYNPCGDLTGFERELCDEAAKSFFNLPFVEVMRAISVKAIAKLEHEENFRNIDALKNWADYNLNETERRANLNFDTFTTLQSGLCKYLVHLLYENRYNIHYNALVDFCRGFDESKVAIGLTSEQLEQKINEVAQEADYSSSVNQLTEKILPVIGGSQTISIVDGIVALLDAFI